MVSASAQWKRQPVVSPNPREDRNHPSFDLCLLRAGKRRESRLLADGPLRYFWCPTERRLCISSSTLGQINNGPTLLGARITRTFFFPALRATDVIRARYGAFGIMSQKNRTKIP
jgi:hypothetical protein